jgi:hypothetical protein
VTSTLPPLLEIVPPSLTRSPVAAMRVAPVPVCTIDPPTLRSEAASMRICCAFVVAPSRSKSLPCALRRPLPTMLPCAPGTGEVSGRALDCGHYLAEERPEQVLADMLAFFGQDLS